MPGLFKKKKGRHDGDDVLIAKGPDSTGGVGLSGAPTVDETARDYDKKDKRRKRRGHDKDSMASVLEEAVQDECLDTMRSNSAFDIERGGVRTHVCWAVSADDLGGLSKKTAKDRSKGAIIEAINTNRISAMTTQTLLNANILVIIPTEETLEAADEFSLLVNAPYRTFFVSDDGLNVDDDDAVEVTLEDAHDVSEGRITIEELLRSKGYRPLVDGTAGTQEATTVMQPGSNVLSMHASGNVLDVPDDTSAQAPASVPMDDIDSILGDDGQGAQTPAQPDYQQQVPQPDYQQPDYQQPAQPAYQPVPEPQPDYQQPQPDYQPAPEAQQQPAPDAQPAPEAAQDAPNIDEEALTGIMSYVWDREDLGLELSIEPFELQFDQPSKAYEPFDEDRGTGPLSDYLRQMSKEANAEMAREHAENVDRLRVRYIALGTRYIAALTSYFDLDSGESDYVKRIQKVDDHAQELRLGLDERTRADVQRLNEVYDKSRNAYADAERARAIQRYDQLHQDELTVKISKSQSTAMAEIEAQVGREREAVLADRRRDATKRFEYGMTEILARLEEDYAKMAKSEQATYLKHRERINTWLDDNRADEAAYAHTLAEAQRQQEEADKVRAEWQGRLDDAQADFKRRCDSMRAEFEQSSRQAELKLDSEKSAHAADNDRHASERADLDNRINELLAKYKDLDEEKSREYEAKLKAARSDAEDAKTQLAHSDDRIRHVSVLWVVITILVAITMACLGALYGTTSGINIASTVGSNGAAVMLVAMLA